METSIAHRFRSRAFYTDLTVAAVLFVLSLVNFGIQLNSPTAGTALLAVAAVALRRVFPGWALILIWVMAAFQVYGNERPNVTTVALVLVIYAAASRGSRAVLLASFISAVVGGSIASVYLSRTGTRFTLFLDGSPWQAIAALLAPIGVLGFAWLAGLTVRAFRSRSSESDLRLQAQTQAAKAQTEAVLAQTEAVEAQGVAQAERVRAAMARDVHDIVGHSLAVIIAQADSVQFIDDTARIRTVTATIADTARRSLGEVREVLSGTASSGGGADEPHDLAALLEQVRAAGVTVEHTVRGAVRQPDPARALVVRRVAQEMLANALRHGTPGRPIAFAETWRQSDVVLQVDNEVLDEPPTTPGGGLRVDAAAATGVPSTGLKGMQARVSAVGGSLEAEAVDGTFTARARIPLPHPTEESP
ncbi:signal transduction histidine kinase [Frondihabitans sp. PhB188]|uniref:sensor histidine kinase n=1 Tax=Frondihabitans sp. PhB188 TaxID=2485200 RepID=UPI000F465D33|nr:histidine kinase [Frondihabitans sp. PhB188]ROQ39745.1 signal transduction histidine kinase [Frondihabitans sp. PhB188]